MSRVLPDRRARRWWEIGAGALLVLVVAGGTAAWCYARAWEERANRALTVDVTRSLAPGSPFICRLRDGDGIPFYVYLAAAEEKVALSSDLSCDADLREKVAEGPYRFHLQRADNQVETRPSTVPFADGYQWSFNLDSKSAWLYVIRSRWVGQPDLLVVEQYATCNLHDGRAYFIRDGRLTPVTFVEPGQQNSLESMWIPHAFESGGHFRFRSADYDNFAGVTHERTWYFRPEAATLEQVRIRY